MPGRDVYLDGLLVNIVERLRGLSHETNFSHRLLRVPGLDPDGYLSRGESAVRIDCCKGRTGIRGRFGAAAASSASARRGASRQGESADWQRQRERSSPARCDQRLSGSARLVPQDRGSRTPRVATSGLTKSPHRYWWGDFFFGGKR